MDINSSTAGCTYVWCTFEILHIIWLGGVKGVDDTIFGRVYATSSSAREVRGG